MRRSARFCSALLVLAPWLMAAPEGDPEDAPAPEPVAREFAARPKKARRAFLQLLREAKLVLDPESPEGEVRTLFAEFGRDKFKDHVALPPKGLSAEHLILEPVELRQGRYRLLARFEPLGEGARVLLTAEILGAGYHRMIGEPVEVPRRSNGIIEEHFLEQLEARLAGPPQTAPKP